jgi:hypothetical protein
MKPLRRRPRKSWPCDELKIVRYFAYALVAFFALPVLGIIALVIFCMLRLEYATWRFRDCGTKNEKQTFDAVRDIRMAQIERENALGKFAPDLKTLVAEGRIAPVFATGVVGGYRYRMAVVSPVDDDGNRGSHEWVLVAEPIAQPDSLHFATKRYAKVCFRDGPAGDLGTGRMNRFSFAFGK